MSTTYTAKIGVGIKLEDLFTDRKDRTIVRPKYCDRTGERLSDITIRTRDWLFIDGKRYPERMYSPMPSVPEYENYPMLETMGDMFGICVAKSKHGEAVELPHEYNKIKEAHDIFADWLGKTCVQKRLPKMMAKINTYLVLHIF